MNENSFVGSQSYKCSIDVGSRKRIENHESFLDKTLIPIISESNRVVKQDGFFRGITYLFSILQLILGSLFTLKPNSFVNPGFKLFNQILFIGMSTTSKNEWLNYHIIVIDVIFLLFVIATLYDFNENGQYRKWILITYRYAFADFFNVIIIPNIIMGVNGVVIYSIDKTTKNAIIAILDFICIGITIFFITFITIPLIHSPYIARVGVFFWRCEPLYFLLISSAIPFSIYVSDIFVDDYKYVPHVLMFLFTPLFAILIGSFPYEDIVLNSTAFSYPCMVLGGTIISIVHEILGPLSDIVYFGVPVFTSVAFSGVGIYYMKKKEKKIKEQLNYQPDFDDEYFDSLNISEFHSFYTLQVAMQNHCALMLDYTLPRYLCKTYKDNHSLILFCTWLSSFFPSKMTDFKHFIQLCNQIPNLSHMNKCFLYQLKRIYYFRESMSSKESSGDLTRVRIETDKCIAQMNMFWKNAATDKSMINESISSNIKKTRKKVDALWAEMLGKYPNHPLFVHEFARYLLDGKSAFRDSLQWNHRALLLDSGNHLREDRCFRCFLTMFPDYLKRGYVTTDGTLVKHDQFTLKKTRQTSSNSSAPIHSSSSHSWDSWDEDIEDEESESFLPMMKLRLAMERAVVALKSQTTSLAKITSVGRFILTLMFVVITYILITSKVQKRSMIFEQVKYFNELCSYTELLSEQLAWFVVTTFQDFPGGEYDINWTINKFGKTINTTQYFTDISAPLNITIVNLSREALKRLDMYTQKLYLYNDEEGVLHEACHTFSQHKTDTISSDERNSSIIIYKNETITYDYILRSYLSHVLSTAKENITKRQTYCNSPHMSYLYYQNHVIQRVLQEMLYFYSDINSETGGFDLDSDYSLEWLIGCTPFVIIFCVWPNLLLMTYSFPLEKEELIKIITSLSEEECLQCSVPFMKQDVQTAAQEFSFSLKKSTSYGWLISVMSSLMIIVLLIVSHSESMMHFRTVKILKEHLILTALRRNYALDIGRDAVYYVFAHQVETSGITYTDEGGNLHNITKLDFVKAEEVRLLLESDINHFENISLIMDNGIHNLPSTLEYDPAVINFMKKQRCQSTFEYLNEVNFYQCISSSRVHSYYLQKAKEVFSHPLNAKISRIYDIANLAVSRITFDYSNLFKIYYDKSDAETKSFNILAIVFLILSIILAIFAFYLDMFSIKSIDQEFDVFCSLILRINPIAFVQNGQLISLVFKNGKGHRTTIVSSSSALFLTSHDSIVMMNKEGNIEKTNPATTIIFGYTLQQILGHNIQFIIDEDNNQQFYYIMKLMKSGQVGLKYQCFGVGMRDDGNDIPLHLSLIGYRGNHNNVDSFVVLIQDMTDEQYQKEAVENAKKQAESILLQILPKDIMMRLNRGDKDITLTVPSATVIFIDIEKFSQYSATLSPKDTMKSLSTIFTAFDQLCATYKMITKIKMIGDDYMAAGGLFNPDSNPKEHAIQVLEFALDCLAAIDELNIILNASLQVRIGINTDGPLIAGVLGTEKPLFDIIGDPINVAARLQSTDIPGNIQISESTYQLVAETDHMIEKRGEIELKGKGKRMTYLVYPDDKKIAQIPLFTHIQEDIQFSSNKFFSLVSNSTDGFMVSSSTQPKIKPVNFPDYNFA